MTKMYETITIVERRPPFRVKKAESPVQRQAVHCSAVKVDRTEASHTHSRRLYKERNIRINTLLNRINKKGGEHKEIIM